MQRGKVAYPNLADCIQAAGVGNQFFPELSADCAVFWDRALGGWRKRPVMAFIDNPSTVRYL